MSETTEDIVKRLRQRPYFVKNEAKSSVGNAHHDSITHEAANEIERLRHCLAEAVNRAREYAKEGQFVRDCARRVDIINAEHLTVEEAADSLAALATSYREDYETSAKALTRVCAENREVTGYAEKFARFIVDVYIADWEADTLSPAYRHCAECNATGPYGEDFPHKPDCIVGEAVAALSIPSVAPAACDSEQACGEIRRELDAKLAELEARQIGAPTPLNIEMHKALMNYARGDWDGGDAAKAALTNAGIAIEPREEERTESADRDFLGHVAALNGVGNAKS